MAQCLEGRLSPTLGQILIRVAVCLFICLFFFFSKYQIGGKENLQKFAL